MIELYLCNVDPERHLPGLGADDEGRKQGSEVGRQDDESTPDVDLPCTLMEEE